MTTINDSICYMFNQIYLNLMKEVKDKNGEIKHTLKESYKVFDKKSDEYLLAFVGQFDDALMAAVFATESNGDDDSTDLLSKAPVRSFAVFNKVSVEDVLEKVVKEESASHNSLTYYLYLLFVLGYIHRITDLDDAKKEIVFHKTVELIGLVEKEDLEDETLEEHLDEILDEDLQSVLRKICKERAKARDSVINIDVSAASTGAAKGPMGMEFLENTKIGELAKEISESLDMSKLMEGMGGGEGGAGGGLSGHDGMNPDILSTIIQTVGSKITEKMKSGELNQEDLMSEAISMMGKMNNSDHGDMMSNMMNMMGGMMGPNGGGMMQEMMGAASTPGTGTGNNTKDRLRKKLEMRKCGAQN